MRGRTSRKRWIHTYQRIEYTTIGTRELKLRARQEASQRKELESHGDEPACEVVETE